MFFGARICVKCIWECVTYLGRHYQCLSKVQSMQDHRDDATTYFNGSFIVFKCLNSFKGVNWLFDTLAAQSKHFGYYCFQLSSHSQQEREEEKNEEIENKKQKYRGKWCLLFTNLYLLIRRQYKLLCYVLCYIWDERVFFLPVC